jgi:multiple sugar transport system permease protein
MSAASGPVRAGGFWRKLGFGFSLFILVSPAVLVFFWMISLSLKNELDNTSFPPVFIPNPPTFDNYVEVFSKNNFILYFWNSILVTGGAVLIGLLIGVPAGYGIARAKAYRTAVVILIARMTPALSYLIPLFLLFQILGLIGSIWALLITHLVITVPIIVWVMIGYFEGIPQELEDAAYVDGATMWQSFRFIAMPLARPGMVVGAILAFIFSWNNFVFSIVLGGKHSRTLPSAVYNSLTFEQISWGPLAAAALLVTLPVLVLTVVAQREIVAGLSAGGLKDS